MDKRKLTSFSDDGAPGAGSVPPIGAPITEADLHAYVDDQLAPARRAEVEQFLDARPDERQRVEDWQQQNDMLAALLDPVLQEPLPLRLPLRREAKPMRWRALAAGLAIALLSAGTAWWARGAMDGEAARLAFARSPASFTGNATDLSGFAHRAAVAHVVYSPDLRRPVEVGADQEQALVAWLTKRMGTAVKPPQLQGLGYELVGGRLLPGDKGPVAQFMYAAPGGGRLTLYITQEIAGQDTAFHFGRDGPVNVFYWVDRNLGYALSAGVDRAELLRVSQAVYEQLTPR
jgi:anti-sigma factor RsiW